jgi:diguanylate cyclase (GGDEF)-like protein/PAS domain S-box-containing protein
VAAACGETGGVRDTTHTPSAAAVLVVDDNSAKRLAINAVIAPLGHTIVQVESGEAALHAVMEQAFAVILMDVQMPSMDGYETARLIRMRAECEHTPIIFITAHTEEEAQTRIAYASGAVDFMFTPIVPDVLRSKVAIFVDLFLKSRELERSLVEVTILSDKFRTVLANVADGIVTVCDKGLIESFNRSATELFGYEERDVIGRHLSLLVAPEEIGDFLSSEQAAHQTLTWPLTNRRAAASLGRRKDGTTFPMEFDLTDVDLGARKIHIGCLRDLTERQMHIDALQHQAVHDALTALPNRVLFSDRLDLAISRARRAAEPLALLILDLDEFKLVNDTLGHEVGDGLLVLVAQRLVGALREGDTVARLGGDEFAILPGGRTDLNGAANISWKIQEAFEQPFLVGDRAIEIRPSIGMALFPEHGDQIADLLRRADLAMYEAKRLGTGYAVFASEQEDAPARRLALLSDLRHAIVREELVLHYQPKIDLATKQTIGVEALIRWNHPSGRLMMPGEFIPEIERSDLLIPITGWVIKEALQTLGKWRDEGYDLTMAINLGARCVAAETGLFETVEELTAALNIPPEKLTFEITESAMIDTNVPGLLERLESMGERLSVDDFGTGYSSLAYLQRLPVVEIKADRSFVKSLASVQEDAVIVRAIIDLAHNLRLSVVAEGVEDEQTMNLLIEYGCDAAQGYFFSRPVPGDELLRWLASSTFGATRSALPVVGARAHGGFVEHRASRGAVLETNGRISFMPKSAS